MPFPTTPILDDFTRANESPLGGNWNDIYTSSIPLQIVNDELIPFPPGTATDVIQMAQWAPGGVDFSGNDPSAAYPGGMEVYITLGLANAGTTVGSVFPPVTVVTGVNDEFLFNAETFTVAPGTYTTSDDVATALNAAIGSVSGEAFSTIGLFFAWASGSFISMTLLSLGVSGNGLLLDNGANSVFGGGAFTPPMPFPQVTYGGGVTSNLSPVVFAALKNVVTAGPPAQGYMLQYDNGALILYADSGVIYGPVSTVIPVGGGFGMSVLNGLVSIYTFDGATWTLFASVVDSTEYGGLVGLGWMSYFDSGGAGATPITSFGAGPLSGLAGRADAISSSANLMLTTPLTEVATMLSIRRAYARY